MTEKLANNISQTQHNLFEILRARILGRRRSAATGGLTRLSQRYPPIARYGVFGASMWPIGFDFTHIPPPPLLSVSPQIACEVEVRYPPPPPQQKGYLSDTCAIPHENKAKWVRCPPLRYYLQKVLRDMGGISHWAAKAPYLPKFATPRRE